MGPKSFQWPTLTQPTWPASHVGFCPGDHLLHQRQFFHQSVECPGWTLDFTSLEHAGTQSSTVSLGLNFQYNLHSPGPLLEHAQSQLRLHEPPLYNAGRGAAAVGTKIKGESDLERLRRICQGPTDQHRRQTHLLLLLRSLPYIGCAQSIRYRHSGERLRSVSADRFINFHVRTSILPHLT